MVDRKTLRRKKIKETRTRPERVEESKERDQEMRGGRRTLEL
jgi:hypothetical protein